jgi:hypothetical protein
VSTGRGTQAGHIALTGEAATERANPPGARPLLRAGAEAQRNAVAFLARKNSGSAAHDRCALPKGVASASSLGGPITYAVDE